MTTQASSLHYTMEDHISYMHRRSLPHWYVPGAAHFVTYRLSGTLPIQVLQMLKAKKEHLLHQKTKLGPNESKRHVHKILFAAYDEYLDQASDIDWLKDARLATMIRQNLYHHDGGKYHLHAYCIMPNHVHVLFTPSPSELRESQSEEATAIGESADKASPLSKIMHSLKSFTANEANKLLSREGRFWQPESYDHWVRNEDEFERIVNYIRANPVSAGLVKRHEDWYWSSCHDRYLMDGECCGWLP